MKMKKATLIRGSINRSSRRCGTVAGLLIAFVLACFALPPHARAVCQDGCLTNDNTVLGDDALVNNTTGGGNTAIGFQALLSNTTGSNNTANGIQALLSNTTGDFNTAIGNAALNSNATGNENTAVGDRALLGNTDGVDNTAIGVVALAANTTGINNTAIGSIALNRNTIGSNNTAIGFEALRNNDQNFNNTAIGYQTLSNNAGSNNIAVGYRAGSNATNGNHNIDIGHNGFDGDDKTIRIGSRQTNTYIAGISGVTVPGGIGVIVDSSGHLGTTTSSARYKENIQLMEKASEVILALKPVTFRYKKEVDPDGIPQFGLVAEQVEKVNPDLVACDEQGKPYTVRYEAVNAMLLNEFLKEHRTVQELKTTVANQQKQIEALTEGLQKVSAQLELSKSAPQTVLNDH